MLSKEAKTVLAQVPGAMRHLTKRASALEAENASLRDKLAARDLRDRATKIATEMAEKHFIDVDDMESKVAELMTEPEALGVKEEAIKLAARQMTDLSPDDEREGSGKSQFEAYILGD